MKTKLKLKKDRSKDRILSNTMSDYQSPELSNHVDRPPHRSAPHAQRSAPNSRDQGSPPRTATISAPSAQRSAPQTRAQGTPPRTTTISAPSAQRSALNLPPMHSLLLETLHHNEDRFPSSSLAGLDEGGWGTLGRLAAEHRVVPLLYDRLTRNPESASFDFKRWMEVRLMPPAVVGIEHLGAYAGQVARNNLRFFSELNKYLTHLEKDNISVILLKGAWLAQGIYSSIGLREMNDMDLLFRLEDLPAAWSILSNMGYRPERPVHIDYEITKSHHLPPVLKKGVAVFELHWNITGPGRYYSIPQDGLHDRADDHTIGGQTIKALSPEDQLLHLCLHTSYQHLFSFGLRPYCDIDATITHYSNSLDWDQFTDRAAEYGWSKGTWLALAMARDLLGAEVPEEVLDELRPQGDSAYEGEKTVIQMCEEQLFTKKTVAALVQPHMMDMLDGMGITRKAKIIWGRVCLPKETMMIMYNVKPGSVWIYAYYLLRLWQLIYRHTWNVFRLYRGDAVLSGVAVRKKFLGEFLCGEGEGKIAELSAERSQHPSH